ncbi:MAG: hypothetical protein PHQ43_05510 [Dehalococcoidales bacterium]|nr:hypothetical protein [Dehalococcoidales bacterium]
MAKPKCVPCLGRDVKEAISAQIGGVAIQHTLGQIPDCDNDQEIQVCGKAARAKSAYQEWTSQCMKGKHLKKLDPEAMRDCARQWRERSK